MRSTITLFDLDLWNMARADAVDALFADGHRKDHDRKVVSFVNAHSVNLAARDAAFRVALKRSDALLPDGSGLQLAAMLCGRRFAENLNGTDLFPPLCQAAARRGRSIYFLGSAPGVAAAAAEAAQSMAPDLMIAGAEHGFFQPHEEDAVIRRINQSGADVLLVALGSPLQELWIRKNRDRLSPRVLIGVGAQFDFWSGRVTRAPRMLRWAGLEWLFRLAMEPRRMFRRYIVGNPVFMFRAARHALQNWRVQSDRFATSKRALDVGTAIVGLTLGAPLFLALALAIKLDSRGPVLFRQTRIGKGGRPFDIVKFRSMAIDAQARRASLLSDSDRQGACFKMRRDPRVTRVGRFLRRFSLDELPQLINILRGDMSVVGPRPGLPEEVAAYSERAAGRLAVKPGLTGLWQVSGRADVGFERMIEMDLAYAKSRSIYLDLMLIGLTARAVVTGRGAY